MCDRTNKMGEPWYNKSRFAVFWHHYNTVMQAAHEDAILRAHWVAAQTKESLYNLQRRTGCGQSHVPAKSLSGRKSRKSKRHRQKTSRKKRLGRESSSQRGILSDTDSLYSKMSKGMHIQDPDGEAYEDMELSDDILNFLEESKRHREEYKIRKAMKQKQQQNAPDSGLMHNTGGASPQEHPDVIRSREMKLLYGEAAPRLHAMETAMQLSYDRISTLCQPQFWPNIPLKVLYDSKSNP